MGRIKGHYEWDDDDLTPGHKKEGGLHQNLFDKDGSLRGSARFVPDDRDDTDSFVVSESVYVPTEQRRKSREQEELEEAIAAVIGHLIDQGVSKVRREISQWYQETGRPAFDARRAKIAERRTRRKVSKGGAERGVAGEEPSQEVAALRPDMSRAEAQARYLAALASRAYSDEQMRLVVNANILDVEGDGLLGIERALAQIPPAQMKILLEKMVADPSMLTEHTLAELASILAKRDQRSLE